MSIFRQLTTFATNYVYGKFSAATWRAGGVPHITTKCSVLVNYRLEIVGDESVTFIDYSAGKRNRGLINDFNPSLLRTSFLALVGSCLGTSG